MRVASIVAKLGLAGLLLHVVLFPDLPQYTGKGMGYRLALYPIAAVLVPLLWRIGRGHRRPRRYPALVDLCVVLPFLFDMAGNAANLYDSVTWWDDFMHVLNWIPWVAAFGLALRSRLPRRTEVAALTVGFGATTHILWEIGEYLTFVEGNAAESASAYRDTIGDLAGSLLGSVIGAALVGTVLWNVDRAA